MGDVTYSVLYWKSFIDSCWSQFVLKQHETGSAGVEVRRFSREEVNQVFLSDYRTDTNQY